MINKQTNTSYDFATRNENLLWGCITRQSSATQFSAIHFNIIISPLSGIVNFGFVNVPVPNIVSVSSFFFHRLLRPHPIISSVMLLP
jgi:hypothetical protein